MSKLFPTFDVPKIVESNREDNAVNRKKKSLYFDFEKGDFATDKLGIILTANPYDSWVQWCIKTVYTQRWSYLAYSGQVGTEMEEAFKNNTRKSQEEAIQKTITEALLADPYKRTARVYDFIFKWNIDSLAVTFSIMGLWNESSVVTVKF